MNETLAFDSNRLIDGTSVVSLSRRETEVLAVLMANSGGAVLLPTLITRVYGLQDVDTPEIGIRVYVNRLRKKLRKTGLCIVTHPRVGYRIADRLRPA